MGNVKSRRSTPPSEPTFTLDGNFFKREAKEALKSYFLPFSGLYAAVTGREVVFIRRDAQGRIVRDNATRKRT